MHLKFLGFVFVGIALVILQSSLGATQANANPDLKTCNPSIASGTDDDSLINEGESLAATGNTGLAIQALSEALGEAKQTNDQERIATADGALGNAYVLSNLYAEALPLLEESAAISHTAKLLKPGATSKINLGNVYFAQGRLSDALAVYREAAADADQIGARDLSELAQTNQARVLIRQSRIPEAIADLSAVVQEEKSASTGHGGTLTLVTAGRIAERETQRAKVGALHDVAERSLSVAAKRARAENDSRTLSLALGYLGELSELSGDRPIAEAMTGQAIFAAQLIQAPDLLYRWDWQLGRLLARDGDLDGAISAMRRSVEMVESIRNDIPVEYHEGRSSFLETIGDLYRQLADLLLQQAHQHRGTTISGPLLVEARSTLETMKIAELKDYFRDQCLDKAESKTREIDKVATGTAVLYPVILPDRLELLAFFADGPREFVVPVSAGDLSKAAQAFRNLIEKRTTREYLVPAQQLYAWLIAPLLPALHEEKIDTIVWIPDGVLRTVPLAALSDGKDFLIDQYAVATAPGLSLVDPQPISAEAVRATLLVGLSLSSQGFPALPSVKNEIGSITSVRPGTVMLDQDFKLTSVEQALRTTPYGIVHIASHGVFNHDPEKSFLLTYDGKLTLNRLEQAVKQSGQRDASLELLVLSACETAAGDDRAALGLAGIAIKAGARSAFASLWFVSDQASAQLVVDFYQELQRPGMTKALALRNAQLALKSDARFRHPAYWSPFLLIGNWL